MVNGSTDAKGFFDRAYARDRQSVKLSQEKRWNEDLDAWPRGAYVEVKTQSGVIHHATRTACGSVYDTETAERIELEFITAWRRA